MDSALIVEDLPDSQAWLQATLQQAFPGIRVILAGDVATALAQLRRSSVALALVDLHLPDGSGTEVIAHLTAHHPDTLCVVASIFDDDEHIFPALQAGAQGYVLKDGRQPELAAELQGIAAGRPPLSPSVARRVLRHFQQVPAAQPVQLTPRETEVLHLIGKGIRLGEIGELLGISRHTAADHVKAIYRKLSINSRAEAAVEAARRGLV